MELFEQASEKSRNRHQLPFDIAKKAVGTAVGGIAASRVLPLLSEFIPEGLASKGLSKINPSFGRFINKALGEGFDWDEIRNFMGEKINGSEEKPKENKNIIEQYSPELFSFMKEQIGNGRTPIEAGAIAQNNKNLKPAIDKITKDHKTNWSDIIQQIFGSSDNGKQEALNKFNQRRKPGMVDQLQEQFQQGYGNNPQSNEANLKVGDKFIDRMGDEAIVTKMDNKTFEFKTKKRTRSGPLNGLKDEISQNNNQQSQQKQTQGLDPAVMQIIQQGNEILKRAKGV